MTSQVILRPQYIASVSGGKDSLYMLYHILSHIEKYPLDAVVHFELEIDYPFVTNVIDKMQGLCDQIGIPFYRIKPRKTWRELYEKNGFPSRRVRWCNKWKLDAKTQMNEISRSMNCRPVYYIGFCADETSRFKYEIGQINEGNKVIYPLAEDGLTEDKILEWARTEPVFNNFYKFMDRQGCMFCPMLQYKEMAYQMIAYPEQSRVFWEMVFKEWNERGINCLRGDHYTPDYIYNRVKTKYVPQILELLKGGET